jgi:hypothetical protein
VPESRVDGKNIAGKAQKSSPVARIIRWKQRVVRGGEIRKEKEKKLKTPIHFFYIYNIKNFFYGIKYSVMDAIG